MPARPVPWLVSAHLAQLWRGQRLVQQITQQGAARRRQLRPDLVGAPREQLNKALVGRRARGQAPLRRCALRQPARRQAGEAAGLNVTRRLS